MNHYELKRIYGLGAAMDGLGLMTIIFSYAGMITLSFTADKNVLEDIEVLTDCMRVSLEDTLYAVEDL